MARVHPEIYFFGGGTAEGRASMREVLGGKGAGLAEMASLKLPVPPGFTISTAVCNYFYDHKHKYPKGLEARHDGHGPQSRPHRPDRSGPRSGERQSALRLGLVSALLSDVRRRRL